MPLSERILSLDIGTSSCKAVLFDVTGTELGFGKGNYALHYLDRRRVEQSPDEIWSGVCQAIRNLCDSVQNLSNLSAVSISSQISSHFLVDTSGRPLTNVFSWQDSRAEQEANELKEAYGPDRLRVWLGADIPIGPSWPIPKLRWMAKHIPDTLSRAKYLVQPKEWVIWNLTGEWMTDVSSCRGMIHQLYDSVADPLLEWAGVTEELLPARGQPFTVVGRIRRAVAEEVGLPCNLPVVLGWNDLNAAVLGTGGFFDGSVGFDMAGTSEHIGVLGTQLARSSDIMQSGVSWIPFLGAREMKYGVTSSGGQALKWFMDNIGSFEGKESDYKSLIQAVANVAPGSDGVLFLPYLNGERSPWWNSAARGVYFGLHVSHGRWHLARAVLEGVGMALRTIYDRLNVQVPYIRIAGGPSRNELWTQIKADILGVPFVQVQVSEAGCLGAAILAAYGLGWYSTLGDACDAMIRTGKQVCPDESSRALYEERYQKFVRLYQAVEPLYDV